jgi:plasmid stability protein
MHNHLTVRNLPDDLSAALERAIHRPGTSLNQTVIDLLRQSLGVTRERIIEVCYPNLIQALADAECNTAGEDCSEKGRRQIREAVELERTRLRDSQPPPEEGETGIRREVQKQMRP